MAIRTPSENRIDKARYDRVMWSRVCPSCGDYRIVDVVRRAKQDLMDRDSGFRGSFHECGGPDGHRCWNMSKYDSRAPNKPLYERSGK